jgi:hypothetical protein
MKIYVVVVEALRKIEKKVKTQFIIEIDSFLSARPCLPPLNVNALFF